MENNIPTASEFMTDEYQIKHYGTILLKPGQAAIEFAKLHVEAALKEASEDANMDSDYYQALQVYPLTNIK
jgi:hypothetical protein